MKLNTTDVDTTICYGLFYLYPYHVSAEQSMSDHHSHTNLSSFTLCTIYIIYTNTIYIRITYFDTIDLHIADL